MLLVVSMILSSVRFDYIGDVFAADAGATSETGEVTISTPGEAEESEAILEGEEATDETETELVIEEESENEESVDNSAKVLVVDDPGTDYSITINAPEGSLPYPEEELSVTSREILPGTDEYNMYLDGAADALNQDNTESISFARFFDIEILRNGEKIEPSLPVEVKIEYDDALSVSEESDLSIVHFAEDGVEVIDDVDLSSNASELTYEQYSFSITATVITTPPASTERGHDYILVATYNGAVYTVKENGSLLKISDGNYTTDGSGAVLTIKDEDAFAWTYENKGSNDYIRYFSDGYQFDGNQLATQYQYTFIAPNSDNGLRISTPNHNPETKEVLPDPSHVTYDNAFELSSVIFENGRIHSSDGKYLSIDTTLNRVVGNKSNSDDGVRFYFANAVLPDEVSQDNGNGTSQMPSNNLVNHIDISISKKIEADVPMAYGAYYDENGNQVLTITSDTDLHITQDVEVSQANLRKADIVAKDKDGNILNDAFYIKGFSSNAKTDISTPQVRIEGMFKVANINGPVDNGDPNVWQARKDNPIIYSVTAIEPEVKLYYNHPQYGYLYDSEGNKVYTTAVVTISSSFSYFDPSNECPPIREKWNRESGNNYDERWRNGEIMPWGISGMDFKLHGDASVVVRPVVIEIVNDLIDSNGNIIKPANPVEGIKFNVIQNTTTSDPSTVVNKNVGSYQSSIDMTDYTDNEHTLNNTIDTSGSGIVYDYKVYPGMVSVEENIDTVPKYVVDQDGNTWIYRYSYIETEYVNRNDGNENDLHVGEQAGTGKSVATPEVLGEFTDIHGADKFSKFVEFYSHNVYDKVIPPTKEEVSPYQGNGELGGVCAGDQITYSINYTNYSSSAEDIVIKDKLDENVEFVSASNGGTESDGVVTWNLDSVPAGQKGSVTLTVKVLETALESNGGPGTVINGGDTATVQVGNDPVFKLDEVLNPVTMPSKMEVSPYEGNGLLGNVTVGEEIVYEITYKNYKDSAATVVIKDLLDKNVEFVSATNGGVNNNGTVVWTLKDVPAGQIGTVNLTVKVLEGALASNGGPGSVINGGMGDPSHGGISNKYGATVQVGDDKEVGLDQVENPVVLEPFKQEVAPYAGTGKLGEVNVGDEITYEIVYTNYKNKPVDVTIADLFDKNLKFISASDGGEYDADEHGVSWEIKDVPAGKTGKVTVTVKVLEGALKSKNGPGNVINGGFEEPESNYSFTLVVIDDDLFILDPVENPVKEPAATVTTPAKTAAPAKTGDKMPILPVAGIMIIAVVGIVIIARKRRKVND